MKRYCLFILLWVPLVALCGVIPEKSRIIFNGKNTLQSYVLVNTNIYPVVVQLWVDNGEFNKNPELTSAPFVVTPVMSKMEPAKINEMKVLYTEDDGKMPSDRETLYWLNIFEVPPINNNKTTEHEITLSMLTQIKLIYRPRNLDINPLDLVNTLDGLVFRLTTNDKNTLDMTIENPTAYVASLAQVALQGEVKNKEAPLQPDELSSVTILPKTSKTISIALNRSSSDIQHIEYWLIDDQGKFIKKRAKVSS